MKPKDPGIGNVYNKCRFGVHVLIICTFFAVFGTGCKPDVPKIKEDYDGKMSPCYLADKCMSLNSYTEAKQDCSIIIQKCMKYIDYEKCKDDKDCYNNIQVKY